MRDIFAAKPAFKGVFNMSLLLLIPIISQALLISVPFMVLNGIISVRKGKDQTKYILLSIVPVLGFFLTLYLISFLDKDIQDKIDRIHEKLC
jgi:hypothetical protein